MLKKETIKKIAGLLKIKEADLEAAITAEAETDVVIPENISVLTQEELDTRDQAQKNEGIKAGKEIGAKEVRAAAGLEESVGKDPKKIAEAIVSKAVADAKIPANDRVVELEKQNGLLTQKLADKDTEIATANEKANSITKDRQILTALPKNRAGILADDEMLDIVKAKHIKEIDGNLVVVGKDGEPLRDPATTKPLDLASGLMTVFTERKWLEDTGGTGGGGRGKGDEKPAGGVFSKKSEVIAHYEKEGKSINGEHGQEIVAKLTELSKADPSFDMNA